MHRLIRIALSWLVLPSTAVVLAQVDPTVDDLADDPQGAPTLEMVQAYAETPICMRCASVRDLTQLPGISTPTASRLRATAQRCSTLQQLSEEACLTADQEVLIAMTCTMDCTCGSWFESGRLRLRAVTSNQAAPSWTSRVDIATAVGRAGAVVRRSEAGDVTGLWATATLSRGSISIGDVALSSGLGLVHGAASGMGRSAAARIIDRSTLLRVRPVTSSWSEAVQRGVAVQLTVQPFEGALLWSQRHVDGRLETSSCASIQMPASALLPLDLGVNVQHLAYSSQSASASMVRVPTRSRTLASFDATWMIQQWTVLTEVAVDDSARVAWASIVQYTDRGTTVVGAARWSHPDVRNPFGSPISPTYALGNEAGITLGLQQRRGSWRLEASMDLQQRLSKSYSTPMPARSADLMLETAIRPLRGVDISGRLRYEVDDEAWRPLSTSSSQMRRRHRFTFRADMGLACLPTLHVRLRADHRLAHYDESTPAEHGALLLVEVRWNVLHSMRLQMRYTAYSSPSLAVAPTAMEVPIPSLLMTVIGTGAGARWTTSIIWKPWSAVTLGVAAITHHDEVLAAVSVDVKI